jgi:protocatechuate 3,4-dioxygenase beta subunit
MRNVTAENLTEAVVATTAPQTDARTREIVASLVRHLHAFVREIELQPDEWMAGIEFLTATGRKCDALRQEFILLSDVLGVSMLVDALSNRKPGGATESTVLGPFFTNDAPDVARHESIATPGKGERLVVSGRVTDTAGKPVSGAVLEVWEADGDGLYDTQYESRERPDCRGRVRAAADGSFAFEAVVPVSYSIPTDGPVGALLLRLGRQTFRPAHVHFTVSAPGYVPVTTMIYVAGDPFLDSDPIFGVKASLVEPFERGVGGVRTLQRDFLLEPAGVPVTA